jgi:hypothetical protein
MLRIFNLRLDGAVIKKQRICSLVRKNDKSDIKRKDGKSDIGPGGKENPILSV